MGYIEQTETEWNTMVFSTHKRTFPHRTKIVATSMPPTAAGELQVFFNSIVSLKAPTQLASNALADLKRLTTDGGGEWEGVWNNESREKDGSRLHHHQVGPFPPTTNIQVRQVSFFFFFKGFLKRHLSSPVGTCNKPGSVISMHFLVTFLVK